jgi:hypothetical protein
VERRPSKGSWQNEDAIGIVEIYHFGAWIAGQTFNCDLS